MRIGKKWIGACGLVSFATMLFFICSGTSCAQEAPPTVKIALAMTSGLENPGWSVQDPEELAHLREFLKGLPEAQPIDEPQFGGFILTGDEAKCRFPQRVRIFDGIIKATTADGVTRFFQDSKEFEDYLMREAQRLGVGLP